MNAIGHVITLFFDLVLVPFGRTHHTAALVGLSLLTGVGMAFVFKWTSNEKSIRAAKQRLKARILEMRIYQDDPVLIVRAFGGTLFSNVRYIGALMRPMAVLIVPIIIVFMQMDERFSRAPLSEGTTTVLSVQLAKDVDPFETPVALAVGQGLVQDSRPVRIGETNTVSWRLRVADPGTHDVTLTTANRSYEFTVVAAESYRMIGRERRASSWVEPLLHPALPAMPARSPFARVAVDYPAASYPFFFWDTHWIVVFLFYSFLAALVLKYIIKFEI